MCTIPFPVWAGFYFISKFTIYMLTPCPLKKINWVVWFVLNWAEQEMVLLPCGKELPVYLPDQKMSDISLLLALEDATYPSKAKKKT